MAKKYTNCRLPIVDYDTAREYGKELMNSRDRHNEFYAAKLRKIEKENPAIAEMMASYIETIPPNLRTHVWDMMIDVYSIMDKQAEKNLESLVGNKHVN